MCDCLRQLLIKGAALCRLALRRPALRLAAHAALYVAAAAGVCAAQGGASDTTGWKPNVKPVMTVARAQGPIEIDGKLDDPGWKDAAVAGNFSETYPGDKTRPPCGIEALMTYDDTYVYFAYRITDNPAEVRASLCDRDNIWSDDYSGIIFDTFGDFGVRYFIAANPLGIQGDTRMSASAGEDVGFDLVYYSAGRITADGYVVEMAVPFKSLRFPDREEQEWTATFWITRPRASRNTYSWAALDRANQCEPCQMGRIRGIRGVQAGSAIELLPALVASQAAHRETASSGNGPWSSELVNGPVKGALSLGARYALSSGSSLEAAINPDFSQVESDAGQIDVNTTFALYYSERRPFFMEGSDLLSSPITAVYTRSINDPSVAAKVTARFGRMNLMYLGAVDEVSPMILPFEERSAIIPDAGRSAVNIVRARQTFWDDSYVGLLVTDRRFRGGASGTVAGADLYLRFLGDYRFNAQWLWSYTAESTDSALSEAAGLNGDRFDGGAHTARFDGESFSGQSLFAEINRTGEHYYAELTVMQTGPSFRTATGFVTQAARRQVDFEQSYTFYTTTALLDRIVPYMMAARVWNYDGRIKDEWLMGQLDVQFKAMTDVTFGGLLSEELFRGVYIDGIRRGWVNVSSSFSDPFKAGVYVMRGRSIARFLPVPVLGWGGEVSAYANIKPIQQLRIDPELSFAELYHPDTDAKLFSGYIFRTRVTYQFTRELFVRLVMQYDDFDRRLTVEPLLTYRLNPFTVFYVGSAHGLGDEWFHDNHDLPIRFAGTSRQFFLKLQYLIQI
jgi:hypothetical protein